MHTGTELGKKIFFAATAVCFFIPFTAPAQITGWKLVTNPDAWITAAAIGRVWSDSQAMALAEYRTGVLAKYSGSSWQQLPNAGAAAIPIQKRMVNELFFPARELLWAATDSGLYAYWFTSGVPPSWKAVAGVPADSVFSIRISRGSAFVLMRHDILRSDDTGRTWRSVRPPDAAGLTALAVRDSLCVAGATAQPLRSPRTMWLSRDLGATWQDLSVNPDDALVPTPSALAVVRENVDRTHYIIAACKDMIYSCVAENATLWGRVAGTFPPGAHIRDMTIIGTSLSSMTWVVVGSDSGVFLLNTISDFQKWEKALPHSTFRFAADTAVKTSLVCAATFDGLWEWRRDATATRPNAMVHHSAGTGYVAGAVPAFDLRGRILGVHTATDAVNLYGTAAGKRLHGLPVQACREK